MLDDEADSDDDAAPFQVPEEFRVAVDSTKELALAEQKQNPKADELVGKKIMYAVTVTSSSTGITYSFHPLLLLDFKLRCPQHSYGLGPAHTGESGPHRRVSTEVCSEHALNGRSPADFRTSDLSLLKTG